MSYLGTACRTVREGGRGGGGGEGRRAETWTRPWPASSSGWGFESSVAPGAAMPGPQHLCNGHSGACWRLGGGEMSSVSRHFHPQRHPHRLNISTTMVAIQ